MRRVLVVGCLVLACLCFGAGLAQSQKTRWSFDLPRGLVAWWTAAPGLMQSTVLYDLVGRNAATLGVGTGWQVAGHPGGQGAVTFDGVTSTGYGTAGVSGMTLNHLTVIVWAYYDSTSSEWRGLVCRCDGAGSTDTDWSIEMDADQVERRILINIANDPRTIATEFPAQQWFHIALTYDQVARSTYLNGVQVDTQAFTTAITTNKNEIRIGQNWFVPWLGAISSVKVFDRAFSAEEIQRDYWASRVTFQEQARQRHLVIARSQAMAQPNTGFFLLME